jgi:hypothetical protein
MHPLTFPIALVVAVFVAASGFAQSRGSSPNPQTAAEEDRKGETSGRYYGRLRHWLDRESRVARSARHTARQNND